MLALAWLVLLSAEGQSQSQSRTAKPNRQLTLGPVIGKASQISMDNVQHSAWDGLLRRYVDKSGAVNYKAWNSNAADSATLDRYLATLATASLEMPATSANRKAFWINAYNAVTVKGILQEYPTTSIRNHTSKIGGYNIWKNLLLNVGGRQISLDSIEHKALRPMGDPRIHFAIVCASKGCPRLLNQAYVGENLEAQLDLNARHFFSVAQNFQHDARRRTFKLSAIMDWFGTDFGADQASQLRAIAPFLPTQAAQAAANANSVRVSYLKYSWDLNEQTKKMATQRSPMQRGSQPRGSNKR
jgi:hypothetical protein